jgi:hypothetical protein
VVEVIYTSAFANWWDGLTEEQQDDIDRCVHLLEARGRELRVQSGGHPLRVIYVFDPHRQAVLLIGGDKTGRDRFYAQMISAAEREYEEYLREIRP